MAIYKVGEKIADYLYEIEYTSYSWEKEHEKFPINPSIGLCSALRKGDFLGRNYDWLYDKSTSFVIKVPASSKRHGSVGVATSNSKYFDDISELSPTDPFFDILPFYTLDGINDQGVACEINIVPRDDGGITTGTNPDGEPLCVISMVRFILDNADSALDGVQKLYERNLHSSHAAMDLEIHCMIADADSTYVVEFVDDSIIVISDQDDTYLSFVDDKPIMTNFYLSGNHNGVFDGNTCTAAIPTKGSDTYDAETTTLTPHAEGLERWDLMYNNYDTLDVPDLMKLVQYTKTYSEDENPIWYSEAYGPTESHGDININSTAEEVQVIIDIMRDMYEHRSREEGSITWQTVHMSVYNIADKTFTLNVQEDYDTTYDIEYNFEGENMLVSEISRNAEFVSVSPENGNAFLTFNIDETNMTAMMKKELIGILITVYTKVGSEYIKVQSRSVLWNNTTDKSFKMYGLPTSCYFKIEPILDERIAPTDDTWSTFDIIPSKYVMMEESERVRARQHLDITFPVTIDCDTSILPAGGGVDPEEVEAIVNAALDNANVLSYDA